MANTELPDSIPRNGSFGLQAIRSVEVNVRHHGRSSNKLAKRVQLVSKRAALAGKQKLWDSNVVVDSAAQSAMDVYEKSYHTTRSFLIHSMSSIKNIYKMTKDGVQKIEHHLLVPVRDVVILPTFGGVERAVDHTVGFLRSEEALVIASNSLEIIKHTPFIGRSVLAPTILNTVKIVSRSWEIIQYPIPSRANVTNAVDIMMSGAKWALNSAAKEVCFYVKLFDASVTRALSHTQWRVLGFGPYSTLNSRHKKEVIDHLCERYLSIHELERRYEFACHIKFTNWKLYHDLVVTGLLSERGGNITLGDVWLSKSPDYISGSDDAMLLDSNSPIIPLWFYLRNKNGKQPERVPFVCFDKSDSAHIEAAFKTHLMSRVSTSEIESKNNQCDQIDRYRDCYKTSASTINNFDDDINNAENLLDGSPSYGKVAQWYEPCISDVLVDENRYAVSFLPCCPNCRSYPDRSWHPSRYQNVSSVCINCQENGMHEDIRVRMLRYPIYTLMRPILWRFYGAGDEVRRGVWLLETRDGLQPYCEESTAILEDAYLFLKSRYNRGSHEENRDSDMDSVLLTVQVMYGTEAQLVQFRSLNQITAIQKSVTSSLALFKRRVYRGASATVIGEKDKISSNGVSTNAHVKNDKDRMDFSINIAARIPPSQSSSNYNSSSCCIDKAEHLVLVVHGIGEMLRTGNLLGLELPAITSSIIDCCSSLRKNHLQVLDAQFSDQEHYFPSHGKVEYLPIEWHEPFALLSRGRTQKDGGTEFDKCNATLADISLNTIPHLRNFANDTMLDILYFMEPKHHKLMLDIVCAEMNTVVGKYRKLTGFDGQISLLSHSLGSVITWDILSNQIQRETLSFDVVHSFMCGSPVAVFLMMRNQDTGAQHSTLQYDELPRCRRIYNCFHPYDPIAYRIEPLFHRANSRIEPQIIPHWKRGGFRVQYEVKLLWRKVLNEAEKAKKNAVQAVEDRMEGIGLLDTDGAISGEGEDDISLFSQESEEQPVYFGPGHRIDFALQESELENANEYIAALAAHSSYWGDKDLSLFIAKQILGSR